MRLVFFIIYTLLSFELSFAQECNRDFVESIKVSYNRCEKKFEKLALRAVKDDKASSEVLLKPSFIFLPVVFSKKLKSFENLKSQNLLCYLNASTLEFEDAIVFQANSMFGVVGQCPSDNCSLWLMKDDHTFSLFLTPLFNKIREINPDFIFSVYNLPEVYWYVKGDELFALSYTNENGVMIDFKTQSAEEYIQTSLDEGQLTFLSPKRVIVISGK